MHLNQGDIIFIYNEIIMKSYIIKSRNFEETNKKLLELSGILQIFLLLFIAKKMDNIEKIKSDEIRVIISELKHNMDLINPSSEKYIKSFFRHKFKRNIITFKNYINEIIKGKEIQYLIGLFDKDKQKEILTYWNELSKYELFNQDFEKDFKKAIEKSYFDYSLIDVSIYEQERRKKYIDELHQCPNFQKFVFYKTQIDPLSKNIIKNFSYSRQPFYGMGIYFSDMLDFLSFYSGGDNYEKINKNYGKTLPIDETFYCIGTEINYDKENIIDIYDFNFNQYYNDELDHFPTYMEIIVNYFDKMVEKNCIHFSQVKEFEPKKKK